MTAIETDDLVVVTGPLTHDGDFGYVDLVPGEVAQVVEGPNSELPTTIRVRGLESDNLQWIDITSLTPLSEIYNRSDVQWGDDAEASSFVLAAWSDEDQAMWGDLIDIDLSAIHDYVHEESE